MINIRMPNINGQTDKEQLVQIRSYLYQFAEQLQWALSNVEGGGGSNVVLQRNNGGSGTQKATDPTNFNELKALIIKSADIVNAYYAKMTELFKGTDTYEAISDFGTFKEDISNALYAEGSGLTQQLSSIQQILGPNGNDLLARVDDGYIRSGLIGYDEKGSAVFGIEVGQTKQLMENGAAVETFEAFARFTSERLSFYGAGGVEVAYISQSRLHITNATVTGDLELGQFMLDTSFGLALVPIDDVIEEDEDDTEQ